VSTATGTRPPGTSNEQEAAQWVQRMFARIAPRYDFANHLLSFNIDRQWRKALVRQLTPILQRTEATVLDLCCGTGDVLLYLQKAAATRVLGADFCHPMLTAAQDKAAQRRLAVSLFEGDALDLPIRDRTLDAVSIAFGFRNLSSYEHGLQEFHRVLKHGGTLAILEFSKPPGRLLNTAYGIYSRFVLPALGSLISRTPGAYGYLPDSIARFPSPRELRSMMNDAGFVNTEFELLTGGIAALHIGLAASS